MHLYRVLATRVAGAVASTRVAGAGRGCGRSPAISRKNDLGYLEGIPPTTLIALGLTGMAKALEEHRRQPDTAALAFEERIAMMIEREAIDG